MQIPKVFVAFSVLTAFSGLVWRYCIRPSAAGVVRVRAAVPPDEIQSENWPQPAPRLYGSDGDWINTDGKALNLQQLTHPARKSRMETMPDR